MDTRLTRHAITFGEMGVGDLIKVPHGYTINVEKEGDAPQVVVVNFQKGALDVEGSVNGIFNEDLALIIYHRLRCFQKTKWACPENDRQIKAMEDFMGANLGRRIERVFRDVSGTHKL